MENLSFNMAGNSQVFIDRVEQIRIAIHAVKEESERASNAGNGFANVLSKTFEAVAGQDALKKFVSDVIRVRGEYQQLEVSFATMLQSKEKADGLMSQMMDAAVKTPFNLTELANGAEQLIGYGVASEQVNDTLTKLGDIATGAGVPKM